LRVIDYGDLHFDISNHEQMLEAVVKEAGKILSAGKCC